MIADQHAVLRFPSRAIIAGQVVKTAVGATPPTTYVYDDRGRQIRVTEPKPDYFASGDSAPITSTFYDHAGNVHVQQSPAGSDAVYAFDDLGRTLASASVDPNGAIKHPSSSKPDPDLVPLDDGSIFMIFTVSSSGWNVGDMIRFTAVDASGNITGAEYLPVAGYSGTSGNKPFFHIPAGESADLALLLTNSAGLSMCAASKVTSSSSTYLHNDLVASKDGRGYETTYAYDLAGHVLAESVSKTANPTAGAARDQLYSRVYDSLGQLAIETVYQKTGKVDGLTTSYHYDLDGRVDVTTAPSVNGIKRITKSGYDAVGNLNWQTDPIGVNLNRAGSNKNYNTTSYTYDALNRQTRQTLPDPDGSGIATPSSTVTSYNDLNNTVMVTDPAGNATLYTYNGLGQLVSEQTSVYLNTSQPNVSVTRQYQHDTAGNLTQVIDRNGHVRKFTPDALNQVRTETWYASAGSTTALRTITFTYDAAGRMTQADDSTNPGSFDFKSVYDGLGNELQQIQTLSSTHNSTLTQAFDANGNRTQLDATIDNHANTPFDFTNKYSYNPLNQTTRLLQGTTADGLLLVYSDMTLTGQPLEARRFNGAAGDWDSSLSALAYREIWTGRRKFTYDSAGRLSTIHRYLNSGTTTPTQVATPEYAYTYDENDRLRTMNIDGGGVRSYSVDDRSELTSAPGQAYAYDANFNRIEAGGGVGADNRLKADATYTYNYDAEGNLLGKVLKSDGSYWAFSYDYRNRMTNAEHRIAGGFKDVDETNTYDAADRRSGRTSSSYIYNGSTTTTAESYVYDGSDLVMVVQLPTGSGEASLKSRYFWDAGKGQIISGDTMSGYSATGNWYLNDHQGSVRKVLAASSGSTLMSIDYDAFGNIASGTNLPRFTYTSQELDSPTGLYNYGARFYDASAGRFMNQDPAGEGTNPYAYVMNDPMDRTDPTGMASQFNFSSQIAESHDLGSNFFESLAQHQFGQDAIDAMASHFVNAAGPSSLSSFYGDGIGNSMPTSVASVNFSNQLFGYNRDRYSDAAMWGAQASEEAGFFGHIAVATNEFTSRIAGGRVFNTALYDQLPQYHLAHTVGAVAAAAVPIAIDTAIAAVPGLNAAYFGTRGAINVVQGFQNGSYSQATLGALDILGSVGMAGQLVGQKFGGASAEDFGVNWSGGELGYFHGSFAEQTSKTHSRLGATLGVDALPDRTIAGEGPSALLSRSAYLGKRELPLAAFTRLDETHFGASRITHADIAISRLQSKVANDPLYAAQLETFIGRRGMRQVAIGVTPSGWVWHHLLREQTGGQAGWLGLVRYDQHNVTMYRLFHPNGYGGYRQWAIPAGAPRSQITKR